jgi:hypothetical protein
LALDARRNILEHTAVTMRAAAGLYYIDANANTHQAFVGGSSTRWAARGPFAASCFALKKDKFESLLGHSTRICLEVAGVEMFGR